MELAGAARHRKSPRGRSAGTLRSIEPSCGPNTKLPTIWHISQNVPGGNGARGSARHRRSPEGVSFREIANQSNLRFALSLSWPTLLSVRDLFVRFLRSGSQKTGQLGRELTKKGSENGCTVTSTVYDTRKAGSLPPCCRIEDWRRGEGITLLNPTVAAR
jgi:hypothetical protein